MEAETIKKSIDPKDVPEIEIAIKSIQEIVKRVEGVHVMLMDNNPHDDLILIAKVMRDLDGAVIRCQTEK